MKCKLMILLMYSTLQSAVMPAIAQLQSCPVNINFASGDLTNWSATTGLVGSTGKSYPAPNTGISNISEYNLATTGIQVITSSSNDLYGGFPTIPVINGYAYNYSILLGSTATSYDLHATGSRPPGFVRSVSYTISVPSGPASVPYTMTYAYAMVLENGTHNSSQQPLARATLTTKDGVIACASPQYYLPTFNNAGSGGNGSTGATLDTATAVANGFTNSPVLFLSHGAQGGNGGTYLQDVWTKGWTEVTFDLSAYRGQNVTLTLEADNCIPGGHFAYAYVAIRNSCAGLEISGSTTACTNSKLNYSIPALETATYNWTVPAGWTINSGASTNTINVTPGNSGGYIIAHEINGCADLRDTISVTTTQPTIAGQVTSDNTVCAGINNTVLTLGGQTGTVLNWLSSADGITWNTAAGGSGTRYTVQNLAATTQYKALVQNGAGCSADTSTAAIIRVNPQSKAGKISPDKSSYCAGQNINSVLTLTGTNGNVLNWQFSNDRINWRNFSPVKTDSVLAVNAISATTYYRAIVQSGACAPDTSAAATISYVNVPFPAAAMNPQDNSICYGEFIHLNANITIGTSYLWTASSTLSNTNDGRITSLPFAVQSTAKPVATTSYVLTVFNAGCPNPLRDTFHVTVSSPLIVFAGNDTAIVAGQPLQLKATVNDPSVNQFTWTPSTGLNFANIPNPVAILGTEAGEAVTYQVKVAHANGCNAKDDIKVSVFKTRPDIFVPSAFTPNGDTHNDVIRPVYVGIMKLDYFRIYNRWGQLVFSTTELGKGWDGSIGGLPQSSGTLVYIVRGVDYTGRPIAKKGTVVLVR